MFVSLRALRGSSSCEDKTLPSFFVVGPPRTGTTWLHEVLSGSTILPSPTKETRFFDQHFGKGPDWYLTHFPNGRRNRPMGEVAPTYFASAEARKRIAKLIPRAKIICVFRDPVNRVLSLYRLKRAYGMTPWTFEQAILHDPELVESGKYATHLKAWLNELGQGQVLVTVYEDLKRDPQTYLNTITDFLGVAPIKLSNAQCRCVNASDELTHPRSYFLTRTATEIAEWFKAERFDRLLAAAKRKAFLRFFLGSGSKFEALSPDHADKLYELFRPEIEELESILRRDLSAWKSAATDATALQAIA